MLRFKLKSCAHFLLTGILLLPLSTSAKSSAHKEQVNLSILKQEDALVPYMTAAQRADFYKLVTDIKSAESDLRSGHNLVKTKPSKLDPGRDLKPTIERGQQLIVQSEAAIERYQVKLVQLLQGVNSQKSHQQMIDLAQYDYTLETAGFNEALPGLCRSLLEACWERGYETLFFDGVFIQTGEGTQRAEAGIRNLAYDTLVEIDGSNFSITVPINFKLKPETRGKDGDDFTYENAAIFEQDQKALLAIELIAPTGSTTVLLSIRAIDLKTHTIAAHELIKINDLATILNLQAEGLEDGIAKHVQFRDPSQTIDVFAALNPPYIFELSDKATTGEAAALITYTLVKQSGLKIVDSAFIKRSYGKALEQFDAWVGQANASLTVEAADAAGVYQVNAQANDSDRTLSIGTLTLSHSNPAALAGDQ